MTLTNRGAEVDARLIVAVASGKGGVGNSTVAANLAYALARTGLRVGALDADIRNASLPALLGAVGQRRVMGWEHLRPVEANGVRVVSIGQLGPQSPPAVRRGLPLTRRLARLLAGVTWGRLDVLVVDLPADAGSVALDVYERLPMSAALVVTTPDPLVAQVAARAGRVAQDAGRAVLGVVENMSELRCPRGDALRPFGTGGGEQVARALQVPLLAQVELGGAKLAGTGLLHPYSDAGRLFADLADKLARVSVAVG